MTRKIVSPQDALAKILRDAHNAYSRASWDSWLYQRMAQAVLDAGYTVGMAKATKVQTGGNGVIPDKYIIPSKEW